MEQSEAGFARRLAAAAIDTAICLTLVLVASVLWVGGRQDDAAYRGLADAELVGALAWDDPALNLLVVGAAPILYLAASWTSWAGRRSVGMRAVGLRVMRER